MIGSVNQHSRRQQVELVFRDPQPYLAHRHILRLRQEAVAEFAGSRHRARVLDVGCGDGSLSLPLLDRIGHLTLVDTSAAMLEAARAQTPPAKSAQVDYILSDFLELPDNGQRYDLVICAGVLAHVADPWRALDWIAAHTAADGATIIEHTNVGHPLGAALVFYSWLRSRLRPQRYAWNPLLPSAIDKRLARDGLIVQQEYRYGLSRPLEPLVHQEKLYRLSGLLHGSPANPRWPMLGSERISLYRRPGVKR
jgi:SAM-dependent methyltransferase